MNFEQAIGRALDGQAVLFLGAGFSRGALNVRDVQFKTAEQLAGHFAERIALSSGFTLEDAAEAFGEKLGTDELIGELQSEFTAKEVLSFHRRIGAIPWKRIYTTNYDNVLETACRLEGCSVTPVTLSSNLYDMPKDKLLCIHFNGFVDKLDRRSIWSELKLTESSYVTASIADTKWAMLFRQDLRLARAVFFVGYSLADLDIKRILLESDQLKEKSFYVIGPSPDEPTRRRAERFGTVISKSAEEFAELAETVAASHLPTQHRDLINLSLKEYSVPHRQQRSPTRIYWIFFFLGAEQTTWFWSRFVRRRSIFWNVRAFQRYSL